VAHEESIVMPGEEPYHIFEVEQISSVQQFENNPYDTDYLKDLDKT